VPIADSGGYQSAFEVSISFRRCRTIAAMFSPTYEEKANFLQGFALIHH
jgi:hypothetical protein